MKKSGFADLFAAASQSPAYKAEILALQFTRRLEDLMEAQGVSRVELAKRAGVSKAYVTKLFRGDGNYTLETMVRFADALGADLHQHVCDTGHTMRWFESIPGGRKAQTSTSLPTDTVGSSRDEIDVGITAAA